MPKNKMIYKRDHDRLLKKCTRYISLFKTQRKLSRNLTAQLKRKDEKIAKRDKQMAKKDQFIAKLLDEKKEKGGERRPANDGPPTTDDEELDPLIERIKRYVYPLAVIYLFIKTYLESSSSLRASDKNIANSLNILAKVEKSPHWKTGQSWILKLGYYKLHNLDIDKRRDWVWIIDHSIQIGSEKCFIVLGMKKVDIPSNGVITKDKLQLLSMHFMETSNGEVISEILEEISARLGIVPRQIISDEGSDLVKALKIFKSKHKKTLVTFDIKHKIANWFKSNIGTNPQWDLYLKNIKTTRSKIQQTALAGIVPPKLRSKARYMNVPETIKWGHKVLCMMKHKCKLYDQAELDKYFSWLYDFEDEIKLWLEIVKLSGATESYVRNRHINSYTSTMLEYKLGVTHPSSHHLIKDFKSHIVAFVSTQSNGLKPKEKILGSTEIIESVMGDLKSFSDQHTKSGYTKMALALPALVGGFSKRDVKIAMQEVRISDVNKWVKENIKVSVQAERNKVSKWYKKHLYINDKEWFRLLYAS